ncbi:MAG: gamma-glutamylcyclotransferase [Pseudomonadota bacterium]
MARRAPTEGTAPSCWVFGYGSLVWRPDFPFEERRSGWIEGWARRFWQGSTDHRGVPGRPGRVVTLIPSPGDRCWGVAYRISDDVRHAVFDRLDYREKGGYERDEVIVHVSSPGQGGELLRAVVYHAAADNPEYLGHAPTPEIARQILLAEGPSGSNRDYLFQMAEALRSAEEEDTHVFALERAVRAMLDERDR